MFTCLLIMSFNSNSCAQDADTKALIQQADSLQRIMLKDSLQINDSAVNKLYAVRSSLKEKIVGLQNREGLSEDEIKKAKKEARKEAAKEIESLLGKKKYKIYRRMITNRLQKSKSNYREDQE